MVPFFRFLEEAAFMPRPAVGTMVFEGKEPMPGGAAFGVGIKVCGITFRTDTAVPAGASML